MNEVIDAWSVTHNAIDERGVATIVPGGVIHLRGRRFVIVKVDIAKGVFTIRPWRWWRDVAWAWLRGNR